MSFQMHTVELGHSGPWVVMLHGWGQNLQSLHPLGELIARDAKVLLIDLPGFGKSPLPEGASNSGGGWSTDQYADAVWELLKERGIDNPILVGHSFGGRISVRLSAKYPESVRGLILIGSHGIPRERTLAEQVRIKWISTLVKSAKSIDAIAGTDLFKTKLAPKFGSTDYKAAGELKNTLVKTVNENLSSQAAMIKAPSLLLWGAKDMETPPDIGRAYNRLIKGSKLVILEGKDHYPFNDVGSHLCAFHMTPFLERLN